MKHPRILQTLFYLLGYEREQICERDTNCLDFKKAKEFINDQLFQKMANYDPCGEREGPFKQYQKLSFLKANLAEIQEDLVEDFSNVLIKIYRWIQLAIDIRIEDVTRRRDTVEFHKQERENATRAEEQRQEKYAKELEERKAAFEEAVDAELQKQADARRAQQEAAADEDGEGAAEQEEEPEQERP